MNVACKIYASLVNGSLLDLVMFVSLTSMSVWLNFILKLLFQASIRFLWYLTALNGNVWYNLGSLSVREGFHAWLFLYLVKMAFEYTLHVVVVGFTMC